MCLEQPLSSIYACVNVLSFSFFLLLYFVTKNLNADESFCTVLQLIFAMQAAWRHVCEAAEPEVTKPRVNIYEAFSHQIFDNR